MPQSVGGASGGAARAPAASIAPPPSTDVAASSAAPSVDIRIVLFTVAEARLRIALHGTPWQPRLPRAAPGPNASLDVEAGRIVQETTTLREQYLEQLYTLSARDESGWAIVVAYLGLMCAETTAPTVHGGWYRVDDLPAIDETDGKVIAYALARLRAKLGYTTIAFHLLPPTFTLSDLQGAYEAILGRGLDKRNFRRRVIAAAILESTGTQRRDGSHRPALLYRFRATHDRETFLTPTWAESA